MIAALICISRVAFIFANRYLALNRPEQVLRDTLKGLDRKYALMLFEKPTDYLLIEPGGHDRIIPRGQEGDVTIPEASGATTAGSCAS